ncbi:S8 family serine peptidase [Actinocatenispora sera]|uniref:S8 family serine peptidase n=1 Tax=Actinocatenispora sera TaxID=390989 RepID=UPI0033F261FF
MRRTSALRAGAVGALVGGLLAAVALPGVVSAAPDLKAVNWYPDAIHLPQAQQISTGEGVTVAVLDSGVNPIPELSGRVVPGFDPGGGDGRRDRDGHGTSMAALIAGTGDMPGVAPQAKILPVSAIKGEQASLLPPNTITRLVHYAIDHGARVVNMSFGVNDQADPADAPWKRQLIAYATEHRAVLVASTGDDPEAPLGRPADVPGVVAVSGLGRNDSTWAGSSTGKGTVLAAPAERISFPTGVPGKEYETSNGTSGASALVSGVLALIMSKYPDISSAGAVNRLIATAHDLGAKGRDPVYGFGAVDAAAALAPQVPKADGNPLAAGGVATVSSASGTDNSDSGLSTAVLIAVIVVAALLILVLIVVIVTLRSRRRGGGGNNGGGGGGGGGPGGPPGGPGGGPVGYGEPQQAPPQWQHPEREPVPAGQWGPPPPGR